MRKYYLEDPRPQIPGVSSEDFMKIRRAYVVYAISEDEARTITDKADGGTGRWMNKEDTLCDDYGPCEAPEAKVALSSPYPGGKLLLFA